MNVDYTDLALTGLILFLIVILLLMARRIEWLYKVIAGKDEERNDQTYGALSEAHLQDLHLLWGQVRAQVLRDAADDWPTVDAEAERKRLSWTPKLREGGSLVSAWLNRRADLMDGTADAAAEDD